MIQILKTSAHEAVDHMDTEPLAEEEVHHVAADETGSTRDDGSLHFRPRALTVRTLT